LSIAPMVKKFLIANPLAKILGKKYVKLKRKNSSFEKEIIFHLAQKLREE